MSRLGEHHLKVTSLSKSFGDHSALSDLSFELTAGDILGVVGPRGSGKTTLLRLLATTLPPTDGHVELNGVSFTDTIKFRQLIGYLPDYPGDYEDFTVEQCLEYFARAFKVPTRERSAAIQAALSAASLQDLARHSVAKLSPDQTLMLGLARLIMHTPPLLLLDEPLTCLEPESLTHLSQWLRALQSSGSIIIMSSQDLHELRDLASQITLLDQGYPVVQGATSDILKGLNIEQE